LSSTRKLTIPCPLCGSAETFYSCEPKCCFNHVCGECRGTFEPLTRFAGSYRRGMTPPDPPPDATEPAVACIKCESVAVFVAEDGGLVCVECGAVLELELTEIAAP
jgi:hypothetical protein